MDQVIFLLPIMKTCSLVKIHGWYC